MIINHGVRGSVPNPSQKNMIFGGNTPCVEIKTNQYQIIFDCGTGFSKVDFSNNLQSIIFISHFHHDHIQGFAFGGFSSDLNKKIIVTSAHSNVEKTHKFLLNYYNTPYFPVDYINIINRFEFMSFEDVVNKFDDLQINTINLNHPGGSSGYSIIQNKKKFCYLLDNEYKEIDTQKEKLITFCDNSDTIIWDGMYLDKELIDKKGWGHSSVEQGIAFSNQIQVKNFLISHHAPWRTDTEIKKLQQSISSNKVRFASENEVIDF